MADSKRQFLKFLKLHGFLLEAKKVKRRGSHNCKFVHKDLINIVHAGLVHLGLTSIRIDLTKVVGHERQYAVKLNTPYTHAMVIDQLESQVDAAS